VIGDPPSQERPCQIADRLTLSVYSTPDNNPLIVEYIPLLQVISLDFYASDGPRYRIAKQSCQRSVAKLCGDNPKREMKQSVLSSIYPPHICDLEQFYFCGLHYSALPLLLHVSLECMSNEEKSICSTWSKSSDAISVAH
jgi:hypothetical protein